jgi:DNA-binding CsgD family transcriptional regulator
MIGRDRELDAGGRFLKSIADGSACLVLDGEPGIGKTTIWRELLGSAHAAGHRVLSCRPAATEVTLAFAGLADLLADTETGVLADLPSPQRHALGPLESRVAELAAQGLTNRRIAETLFLSAKTVEANLARVYLKLGIRSRAELGAAMAQRPSVRASP